MQPEATIVLLLIILASTYIQTVVGFGFGLIVVSAATVFNIVPVIFSAALVSFTSGFHVLVTMRGEWRQVEWRCAKMIVVGLIPGILIGVKLLEFLSDKSIDLLETTLGVFVLLAAIVLLFDYREYKGETGPVQAIIFGALGGLGGGMFSNSAAPIVFFMHRQKLSFHLIRNTLLAIFLVSTVTRISIISVKGHVNADLLLTIAIALPVIVLTTYIAKKYPPPVSADWLKRFSFGLLAIMGVLLITT